MQKQTGLDARKLARRLDAEARISLAQRRAWFEGTPSQAADTGEPDDISKLPAWAQKLIADTRKEAGDYRIKAKAAEDAKAKAEAEKLAEQGKYKELYENAAAQLEAEKLHKARADALGETITATNKKRIERIPEAMRTVIPTDYPPEKLSAWLDANEALLTKVPAPPTDAGRTGDSGKPPVNLTDAEKEMAAQAGMKPEEYATFKAMRGQPVELPKKTS